MNFVRILAKAPERAVGQYVNKVYNGIFSAAGLDKMHGESI